MNFEWDPQKAAINLRKNGVSFTEAGTVFGDELAITVPDPDHSKNEERYIYNWMVKSPQVTDGFTH